MGQLANHMRDQMSQVLTCIMEYVHLLCNQHLVVRKDTMHSCKIYPEEMCDNSACAIR